MAWKGIRVDRRGEGSGGEDTEGDMKPAVTDINQFPSEEGMIVFPISMSKINNSQNAAACLKWVEWLTTKIKRHKGIGAAVLYSDYLYFHMEERTTLDLKKGFLTNMIGHKNALSNILITHDTYIPKAFSYHTWGQFVLNQPKFMVYLNKLHQLFEKDLFFQELAKKDTKDFGRKLSTQQVMFFLEEALVLHLLTKGMIPIDNEFINHHEQWILVCYPGKPLRTEAYLYQKDFFKLSNPKNRYENHFYDLEGKKLYDFMQLDLEKWDV